MYKHIITCTHTYRKADNFLAWYSPRCSPLEAKFSLMCSSRYLNFMCMLYCFPTIKYCLFPWLPQPLFFERIYLCNCSFQAGPTWLTQAWSLLKVHQSKFSLFSLLVGHGAEETQPGSPALWFSDMMWPFHSLNIYSSVYSFPLTSHWMIQIT